MVSEWIEPTTPERGLTGYRLLQTNRFEARKLNGIDGVDLQVVYIFTKYPRPTRTPAIEVLTLTNRKDERGRHDSDWYVCYRPSREFYKELDFVFKAMDCANLVECGGWRDVLPGRGTVSWCSERLWSGSKTQCPWTTGG